MDGRDPVSALLSGAKIYTLATVAQSAAVFVALPAATRILEPDDFGEVTVGLLIAQIVSMVVHVGLPAAITRQWFLADDGHTAARRALALSLLLTLAGTASAVALAAALPGGGLAIAIPVVAGGGLAALVAAQALLRARGQALKYVAVAVLAGPLAQVAAVTCAVLRGPTAQAYLLGYSVSVLAAAALAFTWATPIRRPTRTTSRAALHIGLPTVPHALALYLVAAGDRLVLIGLASTAVLAQYQIAYLLGAGVMTVVGAANNAWAPAIFAASAELRSRVLAVTTRFMLESATAAAATVCLIAPVLVAVVAPSDYDRQKLEAILVVVSLATGFSVVYLANVHVLFVVGKTRDLAWITPVVAVFAVSLAAVGFLAAGLLGTALATCCAYGLQALLVKRASSRLGAGLTAGGGIRAAAHWWAAMCAISAATLILPDGRGMVAGRLCLAALLVAATVRRTRRQLHTL